MSLVDTADLETPEEPELGFGGAAGQSGRRGRRPRVVAVILAYNVERLARRRCARSRRPSSTTSSSWMTARRTGRATWLVASGSPSTATRATSATAATCARRTSRPSSTTTPTTSSRFTATAASSSTRRSDRRRHPPHAAGVPFILGSRFVEPGRRKGSMSLAPSSSNQGPVGARAARCCACRSTEFHSGFPPLFAPSSTTLPLEANAQRSPLQLSRSSRRLRTHAIDVREVPVRPTT